MKRILSPGLAVCLLLLPVIAFADASIVQEACEDIPGTDLMLLHFAVINFSLPTTICDLHLIPEPLPVDPSCEVVECGAPAGWSCFLNPFGAADWFANTPDDCIAPGEGKSGFNLLVAIPPNTFEFCCYIVQFTDPTGAVILEQEECFTCTVVPSEHDTWGTLKALYR